MITLLRNTAWAQGLHFDVALANNSPGTAGRPPAAAAPNPHTAPHYHIPRPMLPDCDDYPHHQPTLNPCYSVMHGGVIGLAPTPAVHWPASINLPDPIFRQYQCFHTVNVAGINHGPGFWICVICLNDQWSQPWSVGIFANVTAAPPALPRQPVAPGTVQPQYLTAAQAAAAGAPGANATCDFMTRLCGTCETQEILLLKRRHDAPLAGALPPNHFPGMHTRTRRGGAAHQEWPYVTCTCLEVWHEHCNAGVNVCVQHRHRLACEKHDELLIMRAQNDNWLRKIERVPGGGIRACSAAVTRQRARLGTFRACRCGARITRLRGARVPRVYQCLGCEGVIHVTTRPPAVPRRLPLPPGVPNLSTRHVNAATHAAVPQVSFPLRRIPV